MCTSSKNQMATSAQMRNLRRVLRRSVIFSAHNVRKSLFDPLTSFLAENLMAINSFRLDCMYNKPKGKGARQDSNLRGLLRPNGQISLRMPITHLDCNSFLSPIFAHDSKTIFTLVKLPDYKYL